MDKKTKVTDRHFKAAGALEALREIASYPGDLRRSTMVCRHKVCPSEEASCLKGVWLTCFLPRRAAMETTGRPRSKSFQHAKIGRLRSRTIF